MRVSSSEQEQSYRREQDVWEVFRRFPRVWRMVVSEVLGLEVRHT